MRNVPAGRGSKSCSESAASRRTLDRAAVIRREDGGIGRAQGRVAEHDARHRREGEAPFLVGHRLGAEGCFRGHRAVRAIWPRARPSRSRCPGRTPGVGLIVRRHDLEDLERARRRGGPGPVQRGSRMTAARLGVRREHGAEEHRCEQHQCPAERQSSRRTQAHEARLRPWWLRKGSGNGGRSATTLLYRDCRPCQQVS